MSHVILLIALLLQSQASSPEFGYRFTVPEGFEPYPEGKATNADLIDCWSDRPADSTRAMVLCVMRMRGVLPREAMKQSELPANTTLVNYRWRSFDVQGLRTVTSQNGDSVFALVVQVPLRREAIQITYAGSADQEAVGDNLMRATLASFEGETNWLTSTERSERLGKAVGAWIVLAIVVVVALVIRKRRASG